ncbi:hypothetical protein ACSBR2_008077 [Camellia fascicularis]
MIHDFPPNFESYVKNHQLLCQCGGYGIGWVIDGTLIAPLIPEFIEKIKSYFKIILFVWPDTQFLIQFWKVIEIESKRLLTTRHQAYGFKGIHEGLCLYRLMSLGSKFDVDGVSEDHLGLHGRYYFCKEYPHRDHAINCNIKQSLAMPLFEHSRPCCIGVFEMVLTNEINITSCSYTYERILSYLRDHGLTSSKCIHWYDTKVSGEYVLVNNIYLDKDKTLQEINKMLKVVCSTHCLPLAQTWASCRLCNAVFTIGRTYGIGRQKLEFLDECAKQAYEKGRGLLGEQFCPKIWSSAKMYGLMGSFAICLRSGYIEDNVEISRIALVPLLTTMKQHCKSFKVASGEELGEELSIDVLDFSEDGKLYSYPIPQTARTPNRMDNGEEMVWLDAGIPISLEEDGKLDSQNCIINSSQRLQRKARIPISLDDLQQQPGMKLKDAAESHGVSRSTVKRACREYNITWWSPRKRSKDNQLLSNKLVQGGVQEQILEYSQPPISDPLHMQDMATASHTKPHFTAAHDTSIMTIKEKYGDNFIKFQLVVSSEMVEFQQQVAKRLSLQGGTYRVWYQDEGNDWILIACEEDLENYICNSISQGRNTITMLIQLITNCPS